jgi:hypothetical protein
MQESVDGPIVALLRVENDRVEPIPEAHASKELYIAWTLVQDHRKMTVRDLNAT